MVQSIPLKDVLFIKKLRLLTSHDPKIGLVVGATFNENRFKNNVNVVQHFSKKYFVSFFSISNIYC